MLNHDLADPDCKKCFGSGEVPRKRADNPPTRLLGSGRPARLMDACICVKRALTREAREARIEERVAEKLAESVAKKLAESLTPNAQASCEDQSVAHQTVAATLLGPDGNPIPTRGSQSLAQQLTALRDLHQAGALTAAEFARAKGRLLGEDG